MKKRNRLITIYARVFMLVCVALVPNLSYANGSGKVTRLYVYNGDVVIFNTEVHNNLPTCSTVGQDWAVSLKTNSGRAMYSLLLAAATVGKSVTIAGSFTCRDWPDRETPDGVDVSW